MSNRRRPRPPSRRDAAIDALVAGWECACGSAKVRRRFRKGEWELTPLHAPGCRADPHQVSEASAASARAAGFQVGYVPYRDGSGGVVIDGEGGLS